MGNLTELMELFEKKLLVIPDNLKPYALGILATLITIDLGLLAFQLGDIDIIKTLCKKVFKYGMITYFITGYSSLINVIIESFIKIGEVAIGGTSGIEFFRSPSKIIDIGINLTGDILEKVGEMGVTKLGDIVISYFYIAIILIVVFFMALSIFIAWMEFYAIVGIGIIFLPFAVLNKTAFLAEKVFSLVLNLSIKLMVLSLILNLSVDFLTPFATEAALLDAHQDSIYKISSLGTLMFLMLKCPSLVASLLSGSPNLSGNDVTTLGVSVGKSIINNTREGVQKASNLKEGLKGNASSRTSMSNLAGRGANLVGKGGMGLGTAGVNLGKKFAGRK